MYRSVLYSGEVRRGKSDFSVRGVFFEMAKKTEQSMHKRYKGQPVAKRMDAAVRLVVEEGWSQAEAARHTGVSRSRVNVNVRAWRENAKEKAERSQRALQERIDALHEDPEPPSEGVCDDGDDAGGDPEVLDESAGNEPVSESPQATSGAPDQGVGPESPGPAPTQPPVEERRRIPPPSEFMRTYFGQVICPDCGVHHEVPGFHDEIITEMTDPSTRRLLINVAPYHAKSTVGTVYSTIYELCRNPNSRTAIVSKSGKLAERFVGQIQRFLTDPNLYEGQPSLIDDWGPFYNSNQWSKNEFFIAGRMGAEKDPSVSAYGVGSQIYGYRFDRMIFDDIADLENQRNPERIAEMLRWATLEAASRVGKTGLLAFIGTRIGPQDIYSYLKQLPAYRVITYPCIIDEGTGQMLWGDHYPLKAAVEQRDSMQLEMFNLVYQNVDVAGAGAVFPLDILEQSQDTTRRLGMYEPGWRMVLGVDPAGAGEQAGYTAMVVLAVDVSTGFRYVVDTVNVKQMRAPQIKDQIIEFCARYPITEVRVETNGLQSQLFQYDMELVNHLTTRGVRLVPHITSGRNKWDPQFGVESLGPMFYNKQISCPYGDINSRRKTNELHEQLAMFPVGSENPDLVMALWFADLGCRELHKRFQMPAFDDRFHVPARIRRKRHVIDFAQGRGRAPTDDEIGNPQKRDNVKFVNVAQTAEMRTY